MSHEQIDDLPDYLVREVEDGEEPWYFLTINRAADGTWSAAYMRYDVVDTERDPDEPYFITLGGYVNDCRDLNEVCLRMKAKLARQKLWEAQK